MKFCTKCGAQLKDEAQFCNKCGTPCLEQNDKATAPEKIEEAAPAALEESKKEEKKENVEVAKKEEKPSPKKTPVWGIVIAVIAIILIAAAVIFFTKKPAETKSESETAAYETEIAETEAVTAEETVTAAETVASVEEPSESETEQAVEETKENTKFAGLPARDYKDWIGTYVNDNEETYSIYNATENGIEFEQKGLGEEGWYVWESKGTFIDENHNVAAIEIYNIDGGLITVDYLLLEGDKLMYIWGSTAEQENYDLNRLREFIYGNCYNKVDGAPQKLSMSSDANPYLDFMQKAVQSGVDVWGEKMIPEYYSLAYLEYYPNPVLFVGQTYGADAWIKLYSYNNGVFQEIPIETESLNGAWFGTDSNNKLYELYSRMGSYCIIAYENVQMEFMVSDVIDRGEGEMPDPSYYGIVPIPYYTVGDEGPLMNIQIK